MVTPPLSGYHELPEGAQGGGVGHLPIREPIGWSLKTTRPRRGSLSQGSCPAACTAISSTKIQIISKIYNEHPGTQILVQIDPVVQPTFITDASILQMQIQFHKNS